MDSKKTNRIFQHSQFTGPDFLKRGTGLVKFTFGIVLLLVLVCGTVSFRCIFAAGEVGDVSTQIKVYVYVSASSISDEMLDLLGIDANTLDENGYFPAGEITLDESYLTGKDTSTDVPLINSEEDWESVLNALSNMDTSTLTGIYEANRGNNVPEYLNQAEQDVGYAGGSGYSALFRWNMTTSYGFEDQTVQYHLDLRFSTKTITFVTGNNGIESETAADGTAVDERTYITGSIIQEPGNLEVPAGYQLEGYYSDPDFTTVWDEVGTSLDADQTIYIKIKEIEPVTIYYTVAVGEGFVSTESESLNPEIGVAAGSTATSYNNYIFAGWYSEKSCEDAYFLSSDETYVPSIPEDGWMDGTTFYAKFSFESSIDISYVSVTITKVVSGNAADADRYFTITVTDQEGNYILPAESSDGTTSFMLNGADDNTETLSGLVAGSIITLTETDNDGVDSVMVEYNGAEIDRNTDGSYSIKLDCEANEITITNTYNADSDDDDDDNLSSDKDESSDSVPIIALLVFSIVLCFGFVIFIIRIAVIKRRKMP